MTVKQIDFSKTFTDDQMYDCIIKNYGYLGREWIFHQWNWMNFVYTPFKDHVKYYILITLIEKTLQFYDQMNIHYTYEQFYSYKKFQIEQFSITEICKKLYLPKETVRRKVLELEQLGVIKRQKKKIIIDRSAFTMINPNQQLKVTARYLFLFAEHLNKNASMKNDYLKNMSSETIQAILKKNFSLCLRWFYRMQIPIMLSYNKFFSDSLTFHVWGTVVMNQVFNIKKSNIELIEQGRLDFNRLVISESNNSAGLSAMSISEMTQIPRATVIRKCKTLTEFKYLYTNDKNQFCLSGLKNNEISPHQSEVFKIKSKFLRKILNLVIIS
ncbi:hypothetical protein N9341_00950 [Candidatus Pelagibacter sp.]|nr:hypothetical protein [Candidatus Pelagibacter sp.]